MTEQIWFWQRIVSPLMAGLVKELAEDREVVYVAEHAMSAPRVALGWTHPDLGKAKLCFMPDANEAKALALSAPPSSIHICQGLRGNGMVGVASAILAQRSLRRWVVMETVDDQGWRGTLRRLEYRRLLLVERRRLQGILATGDTTPDWLEARGMSRDRVFPFAYFLPEQVATVHPEPTSRPFRFIFVGQLIERKRVDLLIDAVSTLELGSAELTIVGSGPLEEALRRRGEEADLSIRWMGAQPMTKIASLLAEADCLVLPSRHDGWGAVVSEAMIVGTPAICSDTCGASIVVRASGEGKVFPSGDGSALLAALTDCMRHGPRTLSERERLAHWASRLGAKAGADYLAAILDRPAGSRYKPVPPWAT